LPKRGKLTELVGAFLRLGLTSFGGPVAHLGYFRAEFVERRRWLDDEEFGDLVALCQMLPGPASSQVVFALGMRRAGLPGALAASLCFILPSALAMILFAYGVASLGSVQGAGWIHGLKLAAVAVVALQSRRDVLDVFPMDSVACSENAGPPDALPGPAAAAGAVARGLGQILTGKAAPSCLLAIGGGTIDFPIPPFMPQPP